MSLDQFIDSSSDLDALAFRQTSAEEIASDDPDRIFGQEQSIDQLMEHPPLKIGGATKRPDKIAAEISNDEIGDDEIAGTIDDRITTKDMRTILLAEIKKKGIAGHHIDSMNSFYRVGIKQISTKIFTVEGRQKNIRDNDEEDKSISEISYKVEFTDVKLASPTTVKYKSGTTQLLMPNMALEKGLTYSAHMFIDAKITATAHLKNGGTTVRTAELKDHPIASIPCMLGSDLCNTSNCTRQMLKNLKEDPHNPGGYFIIKGVEWVVDNLENLTNNTAHVHKNVYKAEIARVLFISKPGDAFENSFQIIIRYLTNGAITIESTTGKNEKIEIPFYIFFRALGMTRDYDVVNHIVYGISNRDTVTRSLLEILERAFDVDVGPKFAPIRNETDPNKIIEFLSHKMDESSKNLAAARNDENIQKYLNNSMMNVIDYKVFPHIGTGVEHRIRKLWFMGHLIRQLLCVYLGVIAPTDRDSYAGPKRKLPAGLSEAKTYKTDFNLTVVMPIKKQLRKDFKSTPFSGVQLAESVKSAVKSEDLEKMLVQSITTGNKTIMIRRNEITIRLSSQQLYHKNDLNVKSTLNTVNSLNAGMSKGNERSDEMRRVQPSYTGYMDMSQSADTGEKVGQNKQMACSASICGASSSYILKEILMSDPALIKLENIVPEQITHDELAKVFVNGDWIGCCKESHEFVRRYRMLRRAEGINRLTTIAWKPLVREVYFWTDAGRMMRPLVIVYNNLPQYIIARRAGNREFKFNSWSKLTYEHIVGLRTGSVTMDQLLDLGVIEYISSEEQENTYIAPNIDVLRQHAHDVRYHYTHCDIDQAIFGIVSLASPLANHSNSTRVTFWTNHRRQAAAWFALNYAHRTDRNTTLQWYCERPLVSTFSDALTYPTGQNTIVALMLHGGQNMEDSLTVNQSSIDCGMFNASFYNYESTVIDKNEQLGNPDIERTMNIKNDATYEHVKDGLIAEGTLVQKGYVLIAKVVKVQKPTSTYQWTDKSIVYRLEEPVYVERSFQTRNDEDMLLAKVKYRACRPLAVGDKLASRTGNKGIVANKLTRADMPYCADGLVPDIIGNVHSIPTRMAINQIIECEYAQLAVERGSFIDATSFGQHDINKVLATMKQEYGADYGGTRRMFNGCTGEWIDCLIFIGPTTYQRLQKFVLDEQYAINMGQTYPLTHQPLEGKGRGGSLRLGEMEKDVFVAHGTIRGLYTKYILDSDGAIIPICRICGENAIVNESKNIYKCKTCGEGADIANTTAGWTKKVLLDNIRAMNIKITVELTPFTFSRSE